MRAVLAIAGRELKSYFVSPAAYVILTVFLLFVSYFFLYLLAQHVAYLLTTTLPGTRRLGVTENVIRPWMLNGVFVTFWLIAPLLSMRLLAEDRRQGTVDLLLTSPITSLQLVLGKYLGALVFFALMLALSVNLPLWLVRRVNADPGVLLTGYLGIFLAGAMFLAMGIFASSLTDNQIVAALLSMGLVLATFLFGVLSAKLQRYHGGLLTPLSLSTNLGDFIRGVVDSSGIVFFTSMSAFFVFLTQRTIDSQRWR